MKAKGLIDTSFMSITIRNPEALERLIDERT
ncbi:MAG: hypothetical protein IBX46_06580 [Desulfuromonadales bacterium]|nr:hypothetical protein [Desulfuromonadales bacterium]